MGGDRQREEEGRRRKGRKRKRGEGREEGKEKETEKRALEQRKKHKKKDSQRTAVLLKLPGEEEARRPGKEMEGVNATLGNNPLERDFLSLLQLLEGFSVLTETARPKSPADHQLISNRRSLQGKSWSSMGQDNKQLINSKRLGTVTTKPVWSLQRPNIGTSSLAKIKTENCRDCQGQPGSCSDAFSWGLFRVLNSIFGIPLQP